VNVLHIKLKGLFAEVMLIMAERATCPGGLLLQALTGAGLSATDQPERLICSGDLRRLSIA
jgi:hypothetical protein